MGLSDSETKEVLAYFDCFVLSERDQDMQGFLVRLSSLIVNICLAILIKWSDEDLESSVGVVFVQVYTILLATFISMRTKSLSISDSHFALVLTISPLAVYFVYATFRFVLMRRKPGLLYLRLSRSYRPIIAGSTFIMLALWITLQFLVYFARDRVFDVNDQAFACSQPSLRTWIFYRSVEGLIYLNWSYVLVPIVPALFIIYALRHCKDIWREFRRRQAKEVPSVWRWIRWVKVFWRALANMVTSIWIVVTQSHPWFFFLVVFTVYLSWASAIGLPYMSMTLFYRYVSNEIHHILNRPPLQFSGDPEDDDIENVFSFGQLLAGAAIVEPLYQILRLGLARRWDLWEGVKGIPRHFRDGFIYFFTGRNNPWEAALKMKLQQEREMESSRGDVQMYRPVHSREGSREKVGTNLELPDLRYHA